MKVNFKQQTPSESIKFTSLQGELPNQLSHLQKSFSEFAQEFMQKNPGYDLFVSTTKNNMNLKLKGNVGYTFLEKATTKKRISEVKTLNDLIVMMQDNYNTASAGKDILDYLSKQTKPFSNF